MAEHDQKGSAAAEDLATIREQAAAWVLALHDAGSERERLQAECEDWQAGDPRRRRVLVQMQQMWSAVEPGRKRRRRAGALGLLVVFAVVFAAQLPWNVWAADYHTAAGEIREIVLPDGSTVLLNTDSAIDVEYADGQRRVRLEHGELLATVRHDPAGRPFRVITEYGVAAALGTRYGVRLDGNHAMATVHHSRVRLTPRDAPASAVTLDAGWRARLERRAVTGIEPADRRTPDWADRRLVFNDASLPDVVACLRRYRGGWLMLGGDLARSDLRFTGVVPADDSDAALTVLADALSLRVHHATPYLAWLERRD